MARDVPIEDPERQSLTLTDELVVGLAVAFLQIVMLAGAAFAVSLRRRQRELALLSAAGAEPGDLTRAVLASGILLGGVGALLGFALPWLVLVAGRPVLERLLGLPLATFPRDGAGDRAGPDRRAARGRCGERRARTDGRAHPAGQGAACPRLGERAACTQPAPGWTGPPSARRSRGWR